MEPENKPKETSRYYWAGAYIAFGVSFLGIELLALLNGVSPMDPEFQARTRLIIIMIHLTAGLSGGYLVNLRSSVGWMQGGIVTGVMAYVLEQIVHTVLYGLNAVGDQYTMFALIGGSILGALLLENTKNKMKRAKARIKEKKLAEEKEAKEVKKEEEEN